MKFFCVGQKKQNTKYNLEHGLRVDLIWRTELNIFLRTSLNRLFDRLWKMQRVTKEKMKARTKVEIFSLHAPKTKMQNS